MNLNGLCSWFIKQGQEEITHGNMIIDLLASQGYDYDILDLNVLTRDLNIDLEQYSLYDIVLFSLNREKNNTKRLQEILDCAITVKDGIIEEFLRKMIKEQEEEIDKFQTLLDKIIVAKDCPSAILMIDNEYIKY
jgi:ferritin